MKRIKNNGQSNLWLIANMILTAVLILFAGMLSNLISDTAVDGNIYGSVAGLMCAYAVIVFIVCLITVIKVKSWKKLVPVLCTLVVLIIFAWFFFVSTFKSNGFTF